MNLTDPDGRKIDWGDNGRDRAREAYCRGVEAADRAGMDRADKVDKFATEKAYKDMEAYSNLAKDAYDAAVKSGGFTKKELSVMQKAVVSAQVSTLGIWMSAYNRYGEDISGKLNEYEKAALGDHLSDILDAIEIGSYALMNTNIPDEAFWGLSGEHVLGIFGITVSKTGKSLTTLADDIINWLGPGAKKIYNKAGDIILLSKDKFRRIRFDYKRPHPHKNPHAHVEQFINGKWKKSKPIYPKDVPHN